MKISYKLFKFKKRKIQYKKNILINWHTRIVIQNKKAFFSLFFKSFIELIEQLFSSSNSCFVFVLGFESLKAHEYLIEKLLP